MIKRLFPILLFAVVFIADNGEQKIRIAVEELKRTDVHEDEFGVRIYTNLDMEIETRQDFRLKKTVREINIILLENGFEPRDIKVIEVEDAK